MGIPRRIVEQFCELLFEIWGEDMFHLFGTRVYAIGSDTQMIRKIELPQSVQTDNMRGPARTVFRQYKALFRHPTDPSRRCQAV